MDYLSEWPRTYTKQCAKCQKKGEIQDPQETNARLLIVMNSIAVQHSRTLM